MGDVNVYPEPLIASKEGRKNRMNMKAAGKNKMTNMKKDNVVSVCIFFSGFSHIDLQRVTTQDNSPIRNKCKAQAGPSNTS